MKAPARKDLILNVDDNEALRYAKGRMLAEGGYVVIEASNGTEALDLVARRKPDLVLLDVGLPNMDGIEVCRRLKSAGETAVIPVIQVSASFVDSADRVRGLEGGADAYLTAPIDSRVLLATVRALLRARRAEAALRSSEDRFRAMADAASVLMWITDVDGQRTWMNPAWLEFTGRTLEQERGIGWLEGVHVDDRAPSTAIRQRAREERQGFRTELRLGRSDGAYRWILDEGRPLYDADGEFLGFIGSCVDITDRHTVEERSMQLLAIESAARFESDRLNRIKDEFLATLSHELRTPLNAILGWTHLLRTTEPTAEDVAEAVERIDRSARAQARIIEDLLDMSRIISGKLCLEMRPVVMADIVAAAVESVRSLADANSISIDLELAPETLILMGDSDRLQQVVWNLLTNAIKFSDTGSRIVVRSKRVGEWTELVVQDFGRGIEPSFMPYIFERFRQADSSAARAYSGLGLGLSIVKSLLEMHHATIEATSAGKGMGTLMTVRLPLQKLGARMDFSSSRTLSSRPSPPAPEIALKGMSILIVDDDVESRTITRRILEAAQARTLCARNADEALVIFRAESPDLIVSDIGMPGIDGYEFIRRLRALEAAGKVTPAIALSAFARDEDRSQALRAGYQGHIAKPLDPRDLLSQINAFSPMDKPSQPGL